ncbi:hypothetical protein ACWEGQ_18010, partial [Streptomyces seoulensis]
MAEQKSSSVLTAPLHGAASVLRRVPGAGTVGRAAQGTLDKVGAVSPRGRRLAVYTGAGVLGVAGVVEWPVALTGAAVAWLTQPRPARSASEEPREPGRLTAGGPETVAATDRATTDTGTTDTRTTDTGTADTGATTPGVTDTAPGAAPPTETTGTARTTSPTASAAPASRRTRRAPATAEPAEDIATAALVSGTAERSATPPAAQPKGPGRRARSASPTDKPPTGKSATGKASADKPATGPAATGALGPTARPGRT